MSFRLEKTMRIVDELVGFCCKRGGNNITIHYNIEQPTETVISVIAKNVIANEDDIETLKTAINQGRQYEVEECFWVVSGDDSFGDELTLIGIMLDYGDLTYENNILSIKAYRKEEQKKR
ncbi:MAG: hypothetical protein ACK5LY_05495 [Lachnospirales bacterium]